MPSLRPTLSIAQQRKVLVTLLLAIGVLVGWQDANDNADHVVRKFLPTPLPDAYKTLDFTNAEAAWSGLAIDPQGNLQIDALTESALLDAIPFTDGDAAERLAFLLEKQFGTTARQQIMTLLPILKRYKEEEQRWWASNGSRDPPPHQELFQLQDELLGEALADKLFAEQRRLVDLMLESHRIRNDATLTQAQKDQALMSLHTTDERQHAFTE